jgi:SAM-dependent methyltransferase
VNQHQTQPDDTPRPSPVRAPKPIRFILGLHERIVVHGVRYKELSQDTLRRAMSRRGVGFKEYAVRFPQGRRMRIKVTPWRWYEDLTGPVTLPLFQRAETMIRPGSRVLALRAGTGYAAAYLAGRVGPSGAVVCLDDDDESVRYARWRYPRPNVAYEDTNSRPPHRDLAGETDGSFDAAILVDAFRPADDAAELLAECMRVVAAGGWIYLVTPLPTDTSDPLAPTAPTVMTKADITRLVAAAHDRLGSDAHPCFIRWLDAVDDEQSERPATSWQLGPRVAAFIRLGDAPEQTT